MDEKHAWYSRYTCAFFITCFYFLFIYTLGVNVPQVDDFTNFLFFFCFKGRSTTYRICRDRQGMVPYAYARDKHVDALAVDFFVDRGSLPEESDAMLIELDGKSIALVPLGASESSSGSSSAVWRMW